MLKVGAKLEKLVIDQCLAVGAGCYKGCGLASGAVGIGSESEHCFYIQSGHCLYIQCF